MNTVTPAATRPHAVDGRRCAMSRVRAMQAGLFLIAFAAPCANVVQAEPRILWRMSFDVSLMPDEQPLLNQCILRAPAAFEEPSEAIADEPGSAVSIANLLLEADGSEQGRAVIGRVTRWNLLRKPMLKPPPFRVPNEAFKLVRNMPQAYAGMMFVVGWLLLLVSVGLGYLSRRIEPYSAADPATWNPEVPRAHAPILIDSNEMRVAAVCPDHRL